MTNSDQPLDCIEQTGRVLRQEGERVDVQFMSLSACSSCNAKGMCSVTEMKEKEVSVKTRERYEAGDLVTIYMEASAGPRAVFYGFFLPFLILISFLIALILITGDEGLSALISIAILVLYYLVLSRQKARMEKKFEFRIRRSAG